MNIRQSNRTYLQEESLAMRSCQFVPKFPVYSAMAAVIVNSGVFGNSCHTFTFLNSPAASLATKPLCSRSVECPLLLLNNQILR